MFKENAHFGALDLFTSQKKGLHKVIRRLSTFRIWMLSLAFNILNCLVVNEGDEETTS